MVRYEIRVAHPHAAYEYRDTIQEAADRAFELHQSEQKRDPQFGPPLKVTVWRMTEDEIPLSFNQEKKKNENS